jgi:hypothetical protein
MIVAGTLTNKMAPALRKGALGDRVTGHRVQWGFKLILSLRPNARASMGHLHGFMCQRVSRSSPSRLAFYTREISVHRHRDDKFSDDATGSRLGRGWVAACSAR